jgi:hypothetical protein
MDFLPFGNQIVGLSFLFSFLSLCKNIIISLETN